MVVFILFLFVRLGGTAKLFFIRLLFERVQEVGVVGGGPRFVGSKLLLSYVGVVVVVVVILHSLL